MATIYNSNLTKELIDVAKLQTSRDIVPNQIAEKVVPVIDVNPKHSRVINVVRSAAAVNALATNIYTTPATNQDFYLTSLCLSTIKDATATAVTVLIDLTIDGAVRNVMVIGCLTLTAQSGNMALSFPIPIKIDRNTTINVRNSTNVGNISSYAELTGYLVENAGA